ncbi:MAG: hypothetical protein WA139_03560 [Candidatus Aenigmatarchaeota archaeon]
MINKLLSKVNEKGSSFAKIILKITSEMSHKETTNTSAEHAIKSAVFYINLLDLYHESKDKNYATFSKNADIFRREADKQRSKIYKFIPAAFRKDLEEVERKALTFFDYEDKIRKKIKEGIRFKESEIYKYTYMRAGDNLIYGKIIESFFPEWCLTEELRINTMLFDMCKDMIDYNDDVKNELPNVLYMYLCTKKKKMEMPCDIKGAIIMAKRIGISAQIINFASNQKKKALTSDNLEKSQTLRNAILYRNDSLIQALTNGIKPKPFKF